MKYKVAALDGDSCLFALKLAGESGEKLVEFNYLELQNYCIFKSNKMFNFAL